MKLYQAAKAGFTLFELVIMIVLIGILAAVTIPKFLHPSSNAQAAATTTVAGALSTANANNFSIRSLSASIGSAVNNCTDVANLLQGGLPTGYTIRSGTTTIDKTTTCTLNGPSNTTASFSATGIN